MTDSSRPIAASTLAPVFRDVFVHHACGVERTEAEIDVLVASFAQMAAAISTGNNADSVLVRYIAIARGVAAQSPNLEPPRMAPTSEAVADGAAPLCISQECAKAIDVGAAAGAEASATNAEAEASATNAEAAAGAEAAAEASAGAAAASTSAEAV